MVVVKIEVLVHIPSLTQTTVLRGAFYNDPGTKKESMDNIKLQQEFVPR